MLSVTPNLDHLANLASQLSPREQLELLVRIGQRLGVVLEQPADYLAGSAAAVLQAVSQPPHLDAQAVNDLDSAIAQGRLPVQPEGAFDSGNRR